jgi:hypothetical protein
MATEQVTYEQLDNLLTSLGFRSEKVNRWKRYEHAESDTVIILGDRKPTEFALPSEVVSAQRHLIEKGLVDEDELQQMLLNGAAR